MYVNQFCFYVFLILHNKAKYFRIGHQNNTVLCLLKNEQKTSDLNDDRAMCYFDAYFTFQNKFCINFF